MSEGSGSGPGLDPPILRALARAIGDLAYGTVELTIHDRRVVQIERREKIRLEKEPQTTDRADRTTGRSQT